MTELKLCPDARLFSKLFPWPRLTPALGLSRSLLSSFSPADRQSRGRAVLQGTHPRFHGPRRESRSHNPVLDVTGTSISSSFPSRRQQAVLMTPIHSAPAPGACNMTGDFSPPGNVSNPILSCGAPGKAFSQPSQAASNGKADQSKGKRRETKRVWRAGLPSSNP